jgi:hypothetical protein
MGLNGAVMNIQSQPPAGKEHDPDVLHLPHVGNAHVAVDLHLELLGTPNLHVWQLQVL